MKIQRRIYIANIALHYYVTQQWTFTNQNIIELRSKLKDEDIDHFYYEMETIDPEEFFRNACIGGKEYILNERMENLQKAKAHFRRLVFVFYDCLKIGSKTIYWKQYTIAYCFQSSFTYKNVCMGVSLIFMNLFFLIYLNKTYCIY